MDAFGNIITRKRYKIDLARSPGLDKKDLILKLKKTRSWLGPNASRKNGRKDKVTKA